MAAIISGNSLGLSTSSLRVLGDRGAFGNASQGRSGEGVYVDVSNGNLVVQRRDELLAGLGLSIDTVRTYNSQGTLDGDNNDNWRIGFYKRVFGLTGAINGAGSTLRRQDGDGAEAVGGGDAGNQPRCGRLRGAPGRVHGGCSRGSGGRWGIATARERQRQSRVLHLGGSP